MKTKHIILAMLFFSISVFAQSNKIEKDVHTVTSKILALCKANKFADAAIYIVYHGIDKKRENNDHYNPSVREEKIKVNRVCRKIRSLELLSKKVEFGKVKTLKNDSLVQYIVKVKFKSSDQTIGIKFVFVKVKGNYLLSDID